MQPRWPFKQVRPESMEGDLVTERDPLHGVVWINPGRMSGAPCFFGTRVPVKMLFDSLDAGETIEEFMAGYGGISREHIAAVLALAPFGFKPMGMAA